MEGGKHYLPDGRRIRVDESEIYGRGDFLESMHNEGYFLEIDEEGDALVEIPSDFGSEILPVVYYGKLKKEGVQVIFSPIGEVREIAVPSASRGRSPLMKELLNEFKQQLEKVRVA